MFLFFQHAHEPIRRGPESWFLYRVFLFKDRLSTGFAHRFVFAINF